MRIMAIMVRERLDSGEMTDQATFSERVLTAQADRTREILSARVRLSITEQRHRFFGEVTFTVTGPAGAVRDARKELMAWLEIDRMDRTAW